MAETDTHQNLSPLITEPADGSSSLLPAAQRFDRRGFLNKAGLALAGGCLAGLPGLAEGASFSPSNPFEGEYHRFLQRLRLRRISVDEIISAHHRQRGGVSTTVPPKSMWRDIVPVLKVADRAAREMRCEITGVLSVYRSPAYNARCPGAARNSMHTRNIAIDLRFSIPPSRAAAELRRLRNRGLFTGGIGRYGSFVHIDTRGQNVDW